MVHEDIADFSMPPESYWIASTKRPEFRALDKDINVDVGIVGGGIAGITAAYELGKEGVKVAVLEADKILMGTTGHTTAKLTSQHGIIYDKIMNNVGEELAKQYAEANEYAVGLVRKVADGLGIKCDYVPQSSYVYTQLDKYVEEIDNEAKTVEKLGFTAERLDSIPLGFDIKAALRFDNQAQFHPLKYCIGLVKAITDSGNEIYEQSRVVDIEERDDGSYGLLTDQGKKVVAKKVIIASHYPFYNKAGLYFARLHAEKSYVVAIKTTKEYPGGMYITKEDPGISLRSQDSKHGEIILVGGQHHKTGQGVDTTEHYRALASFAKDTFPIAEMLYRWSTQDCVTMDDIPFIGHYTSKTPNLYITTGYGKWGMTTSIVSSIILKDLIVHGKSEWADVYNPSRKDIKGSAKNYVIENFNVAKELLKGKLLPPDAEDLIPGNARIIDIDGQKIGEFMDEDGNLHYVNTTCTHMGCELSWNSAERSWDCPCHGSRFSIEGKVIEGPAIRPLKMGDDANIIKKLTSEDF